MMTDSSKKRSSCGCSSTAAAAAAAAFTTRSSSRRRPSSWMALTTVCALVFVSAGGGSFAFQPATAYRRPAPSKTALSASTAVPPAGRSSSFWDNLPHIELPQKKNPFQQKQQKSSSRSRSNTAAVDQWAAKYCTVEGLRESFGRNQNLMWGDLDASKTRRLYKSLLPVALLELKDCTNIPPESLAVLAYKARVAAKLYARERCRVPARVAANLFDGYRQWRKYGTFDCTGMSYQQVWDKYAALVADETADAKDNDVTTKICLKIVERSCISNEKIDRMVLHNRQDKAELQHITKQLEQDVKLLLNIMDDDDENVKRQAQKFRALRQIAKVKRRIAKFNKQQQQQQQRQR